MKIYLVCEQSECHDPPQKIVAFTTQAAAEKHLENEPPPTIPGYPDHEWTIYECDLDLETGA
jgi:hypothetical protein